jgi:hypothetical protein
MDTHLNNLLLLNIETYLFTDANIHLLKINHYQLIEDYPSVIQSNGFSQITQKATRIQNESYSLIDHILIKSIAQNY